LWRYWLYSKADWETVRAGVKTHLNNSPRFLALVNPHIKDFRDSSGVEYAESWAQFTEEEDGKKQEFKPIPLSRRIRPGLPSFTLTLEVENPRGDYHPDRKDYSLSPWRYMNCVVRSWIAVALTDKSFSDVLTPYLLALCLVVAKGLNVAYA
jgi:hypothetical protein